MRQRDQLVLTAAEANVLIESTAKDRLGNLFALALLTGLRQGELLGLRWADIDLEKRTLQVRKALQKQAGEWKFIEPKSERSRRKIRLPVTAVVTLELQQQRIEEMRLRAGSAWQDWNLVFPSQIGTPLDGPNVTHHLQQKLAAAGLPRVRFHDLRHTCATLLLEKGIQDRTIMKQLGHAQVSLTLNTYTHVQPTLLSAAANALDEVFGSPSLEASQAI
jgi:integrase